MPKTLIVTTLPESKIESGENNFDLERWLFGHKLEFLYRHKYPLLNAELFFYTTKFCNNVLGNHHKNFIFTLSNKELVAYYFLDELKLGKQLSKKLLDDNFFRAHFNGSYSARNNVEIFLRKYEKYIKKIKKSDADNLNIFQQYWKVYAGVFAYFRTSNPALVDPFIEELRVIINSHPPKDISVDDAIKFLTTPFSSNLITQETEDWFQVLQLPANTEVFKTHILKYPWLFISTYDFNSALTYLEKRYKTDYNRIQDINISPNEFSDEVKEAERVRNKLYTDSEIKRLSTIILTLADDRLLNKCAWTGLDFQVRELFKIMAKKAGITIEDFINSYTYNDVVKLFTLNQILPKDEINKRLLSFTIISNNLDYIFLSGDKSVKLNEKINFSQHDGVSIEGISASKGYAVGKVFIVSMKNVTDLQDQLKNFTEGDILVAGMTEPNLIPYMIKSGGIITDQGGLTSHAAIVARELKKPCVVGTKIATQILKTGDRVELNADTGFIKLIN
ncbi:MAG: PEP-utilizing enzyme [Candidatus Paceibacterota bacterium]